MNVEELLLKISGDSSGAVAASDQLSTKLTAGLKRVGDQAKTAGQDTDEFANLFERLTERFAIYEVLHGALDFSKELLRDTAALEELHLATGIATDDLQRMAYVGAEFGAGTDVMARAVETLSAKLANGDKNATSAVQMLGLSVQDLIAAGPKEAFLDSAEAIGRVPDPMDRAAFASELFGGRLGKTLLPMLRDLRQKMEDVPQGALISEATIESAHKFEVGLDHLYTRIKAVTAETISGLFSGTTLVGTQFENWGIAIMGVNAALGDNAHVAKDVNLPVQEQVQDKTKQLHDKLIALRTLALEPLTAAQHKLILELKSYGESLGDIAKDLGVSEQAVYRFVEANKKAEEEAKEVARIQAEIAAKLVQYHAEWTFKAGMLIAKFHDKWMRDEQQVADGTAKILADDLRAYTTFAEKNAELSMSSTDIELAQIEIKRTAETVALGQRIAQNALWYDKAKTQIDAYYHHQVDVAMGTADTIEERMRKLGVFTRIDLDQQAETAARDYQQMLNDGNYTADELEAAWKRMVNANIAAGHGWLEAFKADLNTLGVNIASALASGGSVGQAALTGARALGGDVSKKLMQPVVENLAQQGHGQLAKTLGDLAGPLGGIAVNLGLALGTKLFHALFGTAGRDAVVNFANSMGGFDALQKKLEALGTAGNQLWINLTQGVGKNNPQQAQAAIDAINQALATQAQKIAGVQSQIAALGGDGVPSLDAMTQAAQRLGVSTDALGGAFHKAKEAADWQSTIDDIDLLIRGGADLNTVIDGSAGKLSLLAQDSRKFGTEIPENAKPWLQQLATAGELLDANGQKMLLADVNGLNFGQTMQTTLKNLNDTLLKLIGTVAGPTGSIKSALTDVGGIVVNPKIKPVYDDSGLPPGYSGSDVPGAATGGLVTRHGIEPLRMAMGGMVGNPFAGSQPRWPDIIPAYLAQGEMVLNPAQQGRLAGALASGTGTGDIVIHHQVVLDGHVIDERIRRITKRQAATGQIKTRATSGRSF